MTDFAKRINPKQFGFSPKLVALVGAIIGCDYGVRDGRGGRLTSLSITSDGFVICGSTMSDGGGAFIGTAEELHTNLSPYLAELEQVDRSLFQSIYKERVSDSRSTR